MGEISREDANTVFERVIESSNLTATVNDGFGEGGDLQAALLLAFGIIDARLVALEQACHLPVRDVTDWLEMIKAGIDLDDESTD